MKLSKSLHSKYQSYKYSGYKWLGEIPEHWNVEKGKWLFLKNERRVRPEDEVVTCFRDGEVTLRSNRRVDGFTNSLKEHGYQGIRKGDLVIHAMDAFAGAIGVSDSDGKSTPVYSACTERFKGTVNQYYYAYFLRSLALNGVVESLAKGIRERSTDFRFNDFGELHLSYPPIEEQTAIANFLDKKTTKIDQAVAHKEKLIELLKERKQIIIQNAVTKGLDKSVKLKDSGIEWIGEIPEHWELSIVKRITKEHKQGYYTTESYVEDGVKLLRITDFRESGNLDISDSPKVRFKKELVSYTLIPGDFVFARTGGAGNFAVFPNGITEQVVFASYLIRFRFNLKKVNLSFLHIYFKSNAFTDGVKRNIHGGVNQNIHAEDIKSQILPIPSVQEQKDIVTFIKIKSTKIDRAITLQQTQIEKLKEYKATLIDSAVTGKIKVC